MGYSQIGIILLSCPAIWLVSRKDKWKRWGYILGLCGQPLWLYSSIENGQWGIAILSLWYTYAWGQGVYNYWIKEESLNE